MKRAPVLFLAVLLAGCVPTADFRDLRDEVRQLQAENLKLKEERERTAKPADVAKKLEALDAKVNSLRIEQQGLNQKLGEMLRQAEEAARRQEQAGSREEESAKSTEPAAAKEPQSPAVLTPTALYNQAYNDYLKGNYDLAVTGFEDFLKKYPSTSLTAHAQYWIGESYFNKKDYRQALGAYERVINEHPRSDKVLPGAMFRAGMAHAELGEVVKAKERLKQVSEKYPQSNEASRARLKLAELK